MIEKELESAERIFYILFYAIFLANNHLNSHVDNMLLELSDGNSRNYPTSNIGDFENFLVENQHFFLFVVQKIRHVLAIIFIPNFEPKIRKNDDFRPKNSRSRHFNFSIFILIKFSNYLSAKI